MYACFWHSMGNIAFWLRHLNSACTADGAAPPYRIQQQGNSGPCLRSHRSHPLLKSLGRPRHPCQASVRRPHNDHIGCWGSTHNVHHSSGGHQCHWCGAIGKISAFGPAGVRRGCWIVDYGRFVPSSCRGWHAHAPWVWRQVTLITAPLPVTWGGMRMCLVFEGRPQ